MWQMGLTFLRRQIKVMVVSFGRVQRGSDLVRFERGKSVQRREPVREPSASSQYLLGAARLSQTVGICLGRRSAGERLRSTTAGKLQNLVLKLLFAVSQGEETWDKSASV